MIMTILIVEGKGMNKNVNGKKHQIWNIIQKIGVIAFICSLAYLCVSLTLYVSTMIIGGTASLFGSEKHCRIQY